jgi:hypothetical protein
VTDDGASAGPAPVTRRYGSFVVRCWWLENGEQRIDVEHMQSGSRVRVNALKAALDWMVAQQGSRRPAPGTAPGAPAPSPGSREEVVASATQRPDIPRRA